MLRMPKTISALALGVAISTAFTVPASALSLIQPAYEQQEQAQSSDGRGYPASAFAAGRVKRRHPTVTPSQNRK